MNKKKQKSTKTKTIVRVATLIMGLGFAGSTVAIALSGVFSQDSNYTTSHTEQDGEAPSLEEAIQMRVSGYEKVLEREPKNITALEGLAQLYLQTRNTEKAIATLEQLVEYYPERQEFASILQIVKQQASQPKETEPVEATPE
ncbi:MAG: tetratricopeptide repeat protein [Cyanobacteria bacterium P01_G01_bin.19]